MIGWSDPDFQRAVMYWLDRDDTYKPLTEAELARIREMSPLEHNQKKQEIDARIRALFWGRDK